MGGTDSYVDADVEESSSQILSEKKPETEQYLTFGTICVNEKKTGNNAHTRVGTEFLWKAAETATPGEANRVTAWWWNFPSELSTYSNILMKNKIKALEST